MHEANPQKKSSQDLLLMPMLCEILQLIFVIASCVLMRYVELLQKSIRELRMCYSNLINRLEGMLVEELGLKSKEYASYKVELEHRYASIKTYLLTERQKTFLTRIIA